VGGGCRGFSEAEEREIQEVAKVVLSGGRVRGPLVEAHKRHARLFSIFLLCVNRENGSFCISPNEAIELPNRTFIGLRILQEALLARIADERKAAQTKAKAKPRTTRAGVRRGR
jgi:hypothetical protein